MTAISSSRRANCPYQAVIQSAKEFLLFQRIEPDENDHTITKQDSDTVFIDAKRQRRRC